MPIYGVYETCHQTRPDQRVEGWREEQLKVQWIRKGDRNPRRYNVHITINYTMKRSKNAMMLNPDLVIILGYCYHDIPVVFDYYHLINSTNITSLFACASATNLGVPYDPVCL